MGTGVRMPGTGTIKQVQSANPGAGIEPSLIVPDGKVWRLISIRLPLVTSAVVANRRPHLLVDIGVGSTEHLRVPAGATQAASLTVDYQFGPGLPHLAAPVDAMLMVGLPAVELYLEAGFRLRTLTTAFDAGDNYGSLTCWVEEW